MARFEDSLIRNDRDEARFRNNYAERIGMYIDNYEAWYHRVFPPYEWRKMRVHQGSEEFAIGLLCLLMRKGRIQFYPLPCRWLHRDPAGGGRSS